MHTTAISEVDRPADLLLSNGRTLAWRDRPLIMGVLNITPDSFSDGGLWLSPESAVDRALEMVDQGADILDLGAESTRPGGGVYGRGAEPTPAEEELRRLIPVLESLRQKVPVAISVDTRKGVVAEAALRAGADIINDISGLADPDLAATVAKAGCPIVLMHSRGQLSSMQEQIAFDNVVTEVADDLGGLVERALAHGIERHRILIDPGIGFGKSVEQNLALLHHLDDLMSSGLPVLVGASRKSFIGEISGAAARDRLSGSLAAIGWAALRGAAVVRVHDVADTYQFLTVWQAIHSARGQSN